MDPLNVLTKFEIRIAFPVPEIIGGTRKIGQSLDTPRFLFSKNFHGLLKVRMDSVIVLAKFEEVRSFTRS